MLIQVRLRWLIMLNKTQQSETAAVTAMLVWIWHPDRGQQALPDDQNFYSNGCLAGKSSHSCISCNELAFERHK